MSVKWGSRSTGSQVFCYLGPAAAAAAAKLLQSCLTPCDPIDGSPPGSAIPGILQARTLEWVAISFSSAWKWKVKVKSLSRVRLLATPWTTAYQAPLSMGFSRQEYWSGVPSSSPLTHADTSIYLLYYKYLSIYYLSGIQVVSGNMVMLIYKHLLSAYHISRPLIVTPNRQSSLFS